MRILIFSLCRQNLVLGNKREGQQPATTCEDPNMNQLLKKKEEEINKQIAHT